MVDLSSFSVDLDNLAKLMSYKANVNKGEDQIKFPTQEPHYWGLETPSAILGDYDVKKAAMSLYSAPDSRWEVVPWIKFDELHKDRSVFSLKTPFKNETFLFFSASNYQYLKTSISAIAQDKSFDERVLREEMIRIFQMKTPRMDPTDMRTYDITPETTSNYVEELNKLVIREVSFLLKMGKHGTSAFEDFKHGPKHMMRDVMEDTLTRNDGSQDDMTQYVHGLNRTSRSPLQGSIIAMARVTDPSFFNN